MKAIYIPNKRFLIYPFLDRPLELAENVEKFSRIIKKRFNKPTFVCQGSSGLSIASMLVIKNKHSSILYFRKSEDRNHHDSGRDYTGTICENNREYIIVDDLICEGKTLKRLLKKMKEWGLECTALVFIQTHMDDAKRRMINNIFTKTKMETPKYLIYGTER